MSVSCQGRESPAATFKEWLTAVEIHRLDLPDMPTTARGVEHYCARVRKGDASHLWRGNLAEDGCALKRVGPGQGSRYHYTCLPPAAIATYEAQYKPVDGQGRTAQIGTVLLSLANTGFVRAFIVHQLALDPELSANRLRDLCLERFGADVRIAAPGFTALVRMPSLDAFRQLVQLLRTTENVDAGQ